MAVVEEPVEEADGGGVLGQEPAPGFERPVGADAERAAFEARYPRPEEAAFLGLTEAQHVLEVTRIA